MVNNINGDKNSGNSFGGNNSSRFNISNLFDISKFGELFGNSKRTNFLRSPFPRMGKIFGSYNRPRQYVNPLKVLPIEEAYRLVKNANCFLLDVRTEMEYSTVRIKGSVNIPLDKLQTDISHVVSNKEECIIVYCATGSRVRRAVQLLWNLGYTNVCIWEGGGINTFAFADLIVYNDKRITMNHNDSKGEFEC